MSTTTMYTYILYDSKLDMYKIGKTTSPITRFKKLCVRNRVLPIGVIPKNLEKSLHKKFADQRIKHPEFTDGKTEWFKNGGKIASYIKEFKKEDAFPINSPEVLFSDLVKKGGVVMNKTIMWDISQAYYGKYSVGLQMLMLIGAIHRSSDSQYRYWSKAEKHNITIMKAKITLSEFMITYILDHYEFMLVSTQAAVTSDVYIDMILDGDGIIPDVKVYLQVIKK